MRRALGGLALASLAGVAAAAASACTSTDTATQITIAISSETEIPGELDELDLKVTKANGSVVADRQYIADSNGYFPQTIALVPADEDSVKEPVTVEIVGKKSHNTVASRRAIVSYFEGRTLLVSMPLRMACFSYTLDDCGATQSCVGGVCKSAVVDMSKAVDYVARYVFPEPGSCFDDDVCLAGSVPVDVDFSDCSFAHDGGDRVNASVEWLAAPGRVIVLNANDPDEGWTVRDATHGVLSPGVCAALKLQKQAKSGAERLYVSTACAPKTANQPSCVKEYGVDLDAGADGR